MSFAGVTRWGMRCCIPDAQAFIIGLTIAAWRSLTARIHARLERLRPRMRARPHRDCTYLRAPFLDKRVLTRYHFRVARAYAGPYWFTRGQFGGAIVYACPF